MWLVGLHFVWWALLAAIFFTGRAIGGLAGHGLCLIACLAPFTYTPTFESLFAFYVLWIATPLKNLKNRPTYIHLGITFNEDLMTLTPVTCGKMGIFGPLTLYFRAIEVVRDDELMITTRLSDEATKKQLVIQPSGMILPPSLFEMKFEATDGKTKLSLTEFVPPLLRGGQGTIKQAIILALHKNSVQIAPVEWKVTGNGQEVTVNFKWSIDTSLNQFL
jgi:hypothetical protein